MAQLTRDEAIAAAGWTVAASLPDGTAWKWTSSNFNALDPRATFAAYQDQLNVLWGPAADPNAVVSGSNDGSGSAVSGVAQHPTLLSSYAVRPSWKVAGVDYCVGVSGTLTSWQDITLPGSTVGATYVRFDNTANVVVENIDFSLNGGAYLFFVGCKNILVNNCNFGGTNYSTDVTAGIIAADTTSETLTVKYCTIDGNASGEGSFAIGASNSGLTTIQYNWIKNLPNQFLSLNASSASGYSADYRFNMMENGAMEAGAHLNFLQFSGSAPTTSITVEYNTCLQNPQVGNGEIFQFYNNGTGTIEGVTCNNNVMISTGTGGGASTSYFIHGGGTANGSGCLLENNYMDLSGAYGPYYPGSLAGWTVSENYNMVTGALTPYT